MGRFTLPLQPDVTHGGTLPRPGEPRPSPTADKSVTAGRQDITVVDGILGQEQRREINDFLHRPGWSFGWKSDPKTDPFSFWHKHFAGNRNPDNYDRGGSEKPYDCAQELRDSNGLFHAVWERISGTVMQGHTLVRCYANGTPFGGEGTVHTDSVSPHSYTAVYFPHEQWHPNWAGETVFFTKDKGDIVASVYPKPNRLVIFRGTVPHVARGVSRSCPVLRVTLMFKTEFAHDR